MNTSNSTEETTSNNTKLNKLKKIVEKLPLIIVATTWSLFFIVFGGIYLYTNAVIENKNNLFGTIPSLQVLENPSSEVSSELYSSDEMLLGKYFRSNRTPIDFEDISPAMHNALLATEDIRFYEHSGIDFSGTIAIPWYLFKGDKRGSSTLTQQLAKNLFKTREKNYRGKLSSSSFLNQVIIKTKEWITAIMLERSYTKKEILSMYLNTVDFGSNSFGLHVASQTFFGKSQDLLYIEEAALLAGLLKAPTTYSPVLFPDNALRRRNTILGQLLKYKFITPEQSDSLQKTEIKLSYRVENHNSGIATYFRKIASDFLLKWCRENGYDLYGDGLKIYTTIDSRMQRYAEEAVQEHMKILQEKFFEHWKGKNPWSEEKNGAFIEMQGFLNREIKKTHAYKLLAKKFEQHKDSIDHYLNIPKNMTVFSWEGEKDTTLSTIDSLRYYLHFLHNGFISMDPRTGDIKAWVGGNNHKYFKYDHVFQGKRQPGSTFKPIVYATILGEAGSVYSPCYKVVDAPVTFMTGDPDKPTWTPQNAEGKYSGDTLTIRQALAKSVNSVTAYMMKIMGEKTPHMVKEYAEQLGITSYLEPVPAMCLGTFDVSIFELAGAYSTFVNEGVYNKPNFISRIEDKFGNVIYTTPRIQRSVLSKETAYVMTYMLRGATEEKGGTGLGLYRYGLLGEGNQIAAKTGTTQNYSDGWFVGVTPQLVSGVWVGGEHRSIHFRTMDLGQGSRMAMPIWGLYMQKVYADTSLHIQRMNFPEPNFPLSVNIDCSNKKKKQEEGKENDEELNDENKIKSTKKSKEVKTLNLNFADDSYDD